MAEREVRSRQKKGAHAHDVVATDKKTKEHSELTSRIDRFLPIVLSVAGISLIVMVSIVAYFSTNPKGVPSTLEIEVLYRPPKCDRKLITGDSISVHYTGKLFEGEIFDSTYKRNKPFEFQFGTQKVIEGWDQGLQGMCIGEKRRLIIPPYLAYGEQSMPKIPPLSTLDFEIELMDINNSKGNQQ